jgi:hypothetical protein
MIRPHLRRATGKALIVLSASLLLVSLALVGGFRRSLAGARHVVISNSSARRLSGLPPTIVWAWERPVDLRFLPAGRVGVSFLAETLTLSSGTLRVRPRLNALQVPKGTPLVACARIEVDSGHPPALSPDQAVAVSAAIASLANLPGIVAIQVDFDAAVSERTFYASMLRDLRRRLPPAMALSITALASWCMDDPWIAGLPVDEAVPMLFRMGPDVEDVHVLLGQGRDFGLAVCRESVGISTDEPIRDLPAGRRRYVFRPEGWSPSALDALLAAERLR